MRLVLQLGLPDCYLCQQEASQCPLDKAICKKNKFLLSISTTSLYSVQDMPPKMMLKNELEHKRQRKNRQHNMMTPPASRARENKEKH